MADFYVVCVDRNETGEVLNVGLESPVHQRVSPFPAPIEVVKPLLTPHHRFFVHDRSAGRGATAEVPVPMGPSRDIESFVRDLRARAPDLPSHADLTVAMSS